MILLSFMQFLTPNFNVKHKIFILQCDIIHIAYSYKSDHIEKCVW